MDGTPRLVHWTSVVRVRPRTSRSITDLLLALACVHLVNMHGTERSSIPGTLKQVIHELRWDRQADPRVRCSVLHECETRDYSEAEVSLVIGINQTNHSTNQERPCTTVQRIKKEPSICQSPLRPNLVTFPVLSQIKPHTPRLVVPFHQFL